MTFSALTNRVVLPRNGQYYTTRLDPIELVVLHTAECDIIPNSAWNVANYLADSKTIAEGGNGRASCHYVVDAWEIVGQCHEEWTAWTAPGANSNGMNIEQAGRAKITDWSTPVAQQMITTKTIPLVADICKRQSLTVVLLEADGLLLRRKGITDHRRVNDAFHLSDHTDCGTNYPIKQVIDGVSNLLGGVVITPSTEDEDEMVIVTSDNGTVYFVGATGKQEVVSADNWPDTEWALKQLVDAKVASRWVTTYTDRNGTKFNGVPQGALDRIPNVG